MPCISGMGEQLRPLSGETIVPHDTTATGYPIGSLELLLRFFNTGSILVVSDGLLFFERSGILPEKRRD